MATPLIDHGQHAKGPPVGEGIVDKVHDPALAWVARSGRRDPVQGDVFASPDPHAQLQAFEPIQASDAFAIHHPALPSQQHPDAQVAEARARVCELTDAEAQRLLVLRSGPSIPRRARQLRQMAGRQDARAVLGPETRAPDRGVVWALANVCGPIVSVHRRSLRSRLAARAGGQAPNVRPGVPCVCPALEFSG